MSKEFLGSLELNRVYQTDCLEGMKLIPDKSIDLILCDLPYGTTACKWDTPIPFKPLWEQYERIIKDNGAVLLFGTEPFSTKLRESKFNLYRYDLYWKKSQPSGFSYARFQPMRAIENICVFYSKKPTYNPQMIPRTEEELKRLSKKSVVTKVPDAWNMSGGYTTSRNRDGNKLKYPTNVLDFKSVFNRGKEKFSHPTQKPVDLFEWLIKTYSNEGDIILDNCIGSGTTAVAALKTNRRFLGFETESKYIEIINKRIESTYSEKEDGKLIHTDNEIQ